MKSESGNAFVVTLLCIILLGALTFVLSRQSAGTSSPAAAINAERASIYADRLMGEALAMQDVVQKMLETGSTIDTLDFILPSDVAFDTGSDIHKVYHPGGGGMSLPPHPPADMFDPAYTYAADPLRRYWQIKTNANTQWTPSAAFDVLYSFLGVSEAVCAKLNEKITGSSTIPVGVGGFGFITLFTDLGTPSDLTNVRCPDCVGYPMLCVVHPSAPNDRVFYTIVVGR